MVMFTSPVPLGVMLMSMLVSVPSAARVLPLRLTPAATALVASVVDSTSVSPEKLPVNVTPETVPPVIATALAFWVAMVPSPRLVRAPEASDAPVPPSATARSVIPVMVPPVTATLVMLTEPVPLGARMRFPFVSSVLIVLPFSWTFSTEADPVPTFSAVATPVPL